jgi:hemolysin III
MNIPHSEKISTYSHGATVPVMAVGTLWLLYLGSCDAMLQLVCLIYGLSAIFLFSASFFYHGVRQLDSDTSILRKLDHTAIFFLIAGTYTPICYLYLDGTMKWAILIAQWSLVLLGIFFKFFYITAPRFLGTLVYLLMGWIVLIPIGRLIDAMPSSVFTLMVAGGLSYTIGAVIYAIKRPDPLPDFFGFHEIFHFFVSGGAILHLAMIIYGVGICCST